MPDRRGSRLQSHEHRERIAAAIDNPWCRGALADDRDRALARFRAVTAAAQIERHALMNDADAEARLPARTRDVPDRRQLIGLPVIVIQTPAWPREDWALPQRPRRR